MAYRVLRNAGAAPPWIEADKEARRLEAEIEALVGRADAARRPRARRRARAAPARARPRSRGIAVDRLAVLAPTPRQQRRHLDAAALLAASTTGPLTSVAEPGRHRTRTEPAADDMADDLVAWGRVIELETRGRRSGPAAARRGRVCRRSRTGRSRSSATDAETQWARNLLADPRCRVRDEQGWRDCVATALEGDEHDATVTALVLRYGTPAERLGSGPSFRLACERRSARATDSA